MRIRWWRRGSYIMRNPIGLERQRRMLGTLLDVLFYGPTWTAVRVPAQRYRRPSRGAELVRHPRLRIDDVSITPSDVCLHLPRSSLSSFKLLCERLPEDCGGGIVPRTLEMNSVGVVRFPHTSSVFCLPHPCTLPGSSSLVFHPSTFRPTIFRH
jgi:hypothetical protein